MSSERVILAIDRPKLREQIGVSLQSSGIPAQMLQRSWDLSRAEPTRALVILETNDDVAALVQTVYEMYLRAPADTPPKIIALVTDDAARRNPRLRAWIINHQAAVLATLTWDTMGFQRDLLEFVRRVREVDV